MKRLNIIRIADNLTHVDIPLMGNTVPAGFPSEAYNYIEDTFDFNTLLVRNKEATVIAIAEGDSMQDAGIFDGDYLVVDRSADPFDGAVAIAYFNQEFLVKKLRYENGRLSVLVPCNKKMKPIPVREDDQVLIWGIVRKSIRNHMK